jgi:4-hydroxybenzoate polyprenyltransferase
LNIEIDKKKNIVLVFLTEFIRIRGVFNWSAISFVGFILGMSSLSVTAYLIPLSVFIVCTFFIMSFTFAINNYYDIDTDRKNPKKIHINAMASGEISKKTGVLLNLVFIIVPLLVSFFYKMEVFFLCAFLIIWMWIYSAPPLRMKGRPLFDVIWHFGGFFLFIMWGSIIAGSIDMINWLVAFSIGIFICTAQVLNHINDYNSDKESGTTTYAVWAGIDTATTTLKIIMLIHMMFLMPLILLYSLHYISSIIILIIGAVMGGIAIKTKKDTLISPAYNFPAVFGLAVYLSCIIYHISILLGESTLGLLPFVLIS